MSGPYAPPPNMEGYEPPSAGDQKKNYPSQTAPVIPPTGYPQGGYPQSGYPQGGYPQGGYSQGGYPAAGYPPAPDFAPAPAFQHVGASEDEPIVKGMEFNTESIRKGFIRKVYSILSVQLVLTLGFVFLFTYHDGSREFAVRNIWIAIVAIIVALATIIAISCCESVRHTSPHNFIVLAIFTIAEGYVVGLSTLHAQPEVVLQAVGLTAVVVIGLTIFAVQTKWDFTMMGGILFVSLLLMIVISLIMGFTSFGRSNTGTLILSGFGALLFAVYLIYDTQLIMGGERKNTLTPEEYILGAIMLYLDIINLFLHLLKILSAMQK